MRVITGLARSKRLETLPGNDVRPTSEKVKEGIFSAIQFDIEGRRFLDLFAGSGQMGIEALSRGAESAVFVDNKSSHLEVVSKNLKTTKLEANAKTVQRDYSTYLSTTSDIFDIAFLDPPYEAGILNDALHKVCAVMSAHALILCEHPSEISLPESINGFKLYKKYYYGKINISCYRRDSGNE